MAWGEAEDHGGHQTPTDSRYALQELHDLTGGEAGQQGEEARLLKIWFFSGFKLQISKCIV